MRLAVIHYAFYIRLTYYKRNSTFQDCTHSSANRVTYIDSEGYTRSLTSIVIRHHSNAWLTSFIYNKYYLCSFNTLILISLI